MKRCAGRQRGLRSVGRGSDGANGRNFGHNGMIGESGMAVA